MVANPDFRAVLKKAGMVTRDPRAKEERNTVRKQLVLASSSPSVKIFLPVFRGIRVHLDSLFYVL